MSLATLFDYGGLETETRIVVQRKTAEIRDRVHRSRQDILEIGERLIEIKQHLGHGGFGRWLEAEFGWSDRFARDLMNVADVFKSELNSDLDITPTALRSLAAPSVPEPARQEAIEVARNGNHVGVKDAKDIISKHKPDRPDAHTSKAIPDLFADDDRREQAEVESREPDPTEEGEPTESEPEPTDPSVKEKAEAERRCKHFLKCLNDVDDLTRAVAARVNHGGYDGLPAVLAHLGRQDKIRVKGKVKTLIERLQGWVVQMREDSR